MYYSQMELGSLLTFVDFLSVKKNEDIYGGLGISTTLEHLLPSSMLNIILTTTMLCINLSV